MPDAAAAATALATGAKTNTGMLSVSPDGERLETILERCMQYRKATGLVTTDALWGPVPAAFAAHLGTYQESGEIARQLADSRVQVLMGFGADQLTPQAAGGARSDNLDLLKSLARGATIS